MNKGRIHPSWVMWLGWAMTSVPATAEEVMLAMAGEQSAPVAAHHVSGNIGLYSDYLFRGISYGRGEGAVQGSVDYSHDSGFFIGLGATEVHKNAIYGNTYEIDLYGGYRKALANQLTLTAGMIEYYYPQNNRYLGQSANVVEFNIALDYRQFNLKYSQSLTDWFGVNTPSYGHAQIGRHTMGTGSSRGSHYLELNYTLPLAESGFQCLLHMGHQVVRNYRVGDYTDYSVGISRDFSIGSLKGLNAGVSYVALDANDHWYVASDGYLTAENKFFAYLRLNM